MYNGDSTDPIKLPSTSSSSSVSSLPPKVKRKAGVDGGINVITAAIFVVGEMAGSGILAIPKAVVDCGWIGMLLVVVFCVNAGYGGTRLGLCWAIVEERYPEHRGQTRIPYPTIAEKAVGPWGSKLVSWSMLITLFGTAIVFLLMVAEIMENLLSGLISMSYCIWFVVFAVIVTPPMWLGSPKDFWIVGFVAVFSTTIACVLIFIQMMVDATNLSQEVPHKPHSLKEFFLSFGTILFSYGGASTFPTIQNDMAEREKFSISAVIGFIMVLCLYMPVAVGGYFVYGDNVNSNILLSLNKSVIVSFANVLIAAHLMMAFFIIINPVCQDIEEKLNVPHEFCLKRCLVRVCLVVLIVLVGETVPTFSKILSLVGGSTITLTTFVLPPLFYMKLCDQKSIEWPERFIPRPARIYLWFLMAVGVVGGTFSTYSAILDIVSANSFTKPCYWPQ